MIALAFDWNSVTLLLLSIVTAFTTWRTQKTAKKVEKVECFISQRGLEKKALAEATAAKAALTLSAEDEAAADTAMRDYLDHMRRQKELNGKPLV